MIVAMGDTPELGLDEIEALRLQVWSDMIGPQRARQRFLSDPVDHAAWHLGLRHGPILVACGRLSFHQTRETVPDQVSFGPVLDRFRFPCCLMNRLVVHPSHRSQGATRSIDAARIRLAGELGAVETWVEAQERRAHKLRHLGFAIVCPSGDREIAGEWLILRKIHD